MFAIFRLSEAGRVMDQVAGFAGGVWDGVQSMVLLIGNGPYDKEEWLANSRCSKTLLMLDLHFL